MNPDPAGCSPQSPEEVCPSLGGAVIRGRSNTNCSQPLCQTTEPLALPLSQPVCWDAAVQLREGTGM